MNSCASRNSHRAQRGGIVSTLVLVLGLLAFFGLLYLLRHPILRLAAGSWIVEDRLEQSDAIIVLSDDNFYADRASRGAELYRQGMAPVVVASGRKLRPYAGIAELMEHDLFERGVPKERIVRASHSAANTREEAEAMLQLATQRKWRSVIVVTSNYHTRRARYIFRHIFPEGFVMRMASARDGDFDPERWWEKRGSVKAFAMEIEGMVVTMWELHGRTEKTKGEAGGGGPAKASAENWGAAIWAQERLSRASSRA